MQRKAITKQGKITYFWFENPNSGLKRTRIHTIEIPFEPFDSELDDEVNPVETYLLQLAACVGLSLARGFAG